MFGAASPGCHFADTLCGAIPLANFHPAHHNAPPLSDNGREGFLLLRATYFSRVLTQMRALVFASVCGLSGVGVMGTAAHAADNPFPSLAGTWNGSGTARFEGGTTESLRCKGYYTNGSGGSNLGLSIRCANASAKVELRANLNYANGSVSGDWEERTYNQSGTVSGKASSGKISLAITGGIEGSMAVNVAGSSHSVNVSTAGPVLKGINISMSR